MTIDNVHIKQIAECAVEDWKKCRRILPSVVIAQAILESGWGTSVLARIANNYFGLNWYNDNVTSKYQHVTYATKQERNGKLVDTSEEFCVFDTLLQSYQCLIDWYTMRPKYANIIGATDYKFVCREIKRCGYATDSQYAEKLINLIEREHLREYDVVEDAKSMWRVYAGSYSVEANAYRQCEYLKSLGIDAFIKYVDDLNVYRVQVGAFEIEANANALMDRLEFDYDIETFKEG